MFLLMLLDFPSAPCRFSQFYALPHTIFDMLRRVPLPYVLSFDHVLFQVVVAPVLLSSCLKSTFPLVVKMITPFAPLIAVLLSSLLACRLFRHRNLSIGYSVVLVFTFHSFPLTSGFRDSLPAFSQEMSSVLSPQ